MKINSFAVVGLASALLSGCWTLSETEYPEVAIDHLPAGKAISVSLVGFEAEIQKYVPIEGHETMPTNAGDRVDGPCVKDSCATNVYYFTRTTVARKLTDRAAVGLERKGYEISNDNPQYVVELKFEGPFDRDYDVLKQAGMMLCTLFTCEKNAETWNAKLRVYDRAAKKWTFEKSYTQTHEIAIWGPIPIASPACDEKITCTASSSWALTALTDLAIADAAKVMSGKAK